MDSNVQTTVRSGYTIIQAISTAGGFMGVVFIAVNLLISKI